MRTQTKIAVIFFLISVSTILILSISVYFFIIRYSFSDFYKRLEIRGVVTAKAELDHQEAGTAVLQDVRKMHLEKLPDEKEYFIEITPGKDFSTEAAEIGIPVSFFHELVLDNGATYQNGNTFYAGIKYAGQKGVYAVVVSADNYYNSHHLSYLRSIFFVGILLTSILAFALSFVYSKLVFNPVREITKKVQDISSQNLHLRLETELSNDEISELKRTFNNMLDRLETSFETQNNFISNASHELSTPLTTIIGEADVTLSKPRDPETYVEALSVILKKAEHLERMTKSLLLLAQTGFNGKTQKFELLRADEILWGVKTTIEKINPKNNVQLNFSLLPENPEKLKIIGVEQLLHLAIGNIVSNGCKYSNYQPVIVSIGTTGEEVYIIVKDSGIGIPEDELRFIYDPFFRASNTKNYEGYGIGLPLTRNIVRMHKGEITVKSVVNEGTTVQLKFPVGKKTVH